MTTEKNTKTKTKYLLNIVQTSVKCPKGQYNSFGRYSYRSLEDICKAVRDVLKETGASLLVEDEIMFIGNRYYVKATARLIDDDGTCVATTTGWAREAESKKGMDEAQITGACSSYARKYALNALLCLDDTKDPDAQENQTQENQYSYDVIKYGEKEKIPGILSWAQKLGYGVNGNIITTNKPIDRLTGCEVKGGEYEIK